MLFASRDTHGSDLLRGTSHSPSCPAPAAGLQERAAAEAKATNTGWLPCQVIHRARNCAACVDNAWQYCSHPEPC